MCFAAFEKEFDVFNGGFGESVGIGVVWAGGVKGDAAGIAPLCEFGAELRSVVGADGDGVADEGEPCFELVEDGSCGK